MKKRWPGLVIAVTLSMLGLFVLFHLVDRGINASAAPLRAAPTVGDVAPYPSILPLLGPRTTAPGPPR
jgi:hypothetical protein